MKKIFFILFILVCLVQLVIPSKMIFDKEEVISLGHEYKFRTQPIDPYDPFRGKYVTLYFDANDYATSDTAMVWERDDDIYVSLAKDSAGFAIIKSISKAPPVNEYDYVLAKVDYAYDGNIRIDYTFNRFYMEESKAEDAEKQYRNANVFNSKKDAYALVAVKKGESALKDVMIDGVSLRVLAGQN